MKTYQTWEMIRLLTENPKLKFRLDNWTESFLTIIDDKLGFAGENGFWDGEENQKTRFEISDYLKLDKQWILLQEPMNFMEILKYPERHVKVEHKYVNHNKYHKLDYLLTYLSAELSCTELAEVFLNGKWYVEEE